MWRPSVSRRAAATAAIGAAAIGLGWALFGGPGLGIAALLAFLFAAVRHDNDLGTCFPLALLFVIVLVVLGVLMMMLSMMGSP